MAVGTAEGDLAVKVLDEYVKDFQKRNSTLRVFGCYLHQDEATPHLHIDFIPYVIDWKGKGMDTRVSLKQALKSLGFQGGNKHDTELNQWMNHEKELKSLEDRRNVLQPIMDNASKEIKEYGMIKTFLPEAGTFERAVPYRENKIKPLFIKMKNQIAALAGKVVELNKTVESWKNKYQKSAEKCVDIQKQLDDVRKENGKLSNDNQRLQENSDRYDRVVRILGTEAVEDVVQKDIKEQKELEEQRRMEQMPKGSVLKQLEWATQKRQMENQQHKKNKTKYRGLEI